MRTTTQSIMILAGEASGDALAAELASALRAEAPQARLFGAGGPRLSAAGVEIVADMTGHSIIGLVEAATRYRTFRRLFRQLLTCALERRPDVIVCVDFAGFNLRFAAAVRAHARGTAWTPNLVQYVSPQVWASRAGRARRMARDLDLLLTIFPFEPAWYATHAPGLRVEFVGHPIVDRYPDVDANGAASLRTSAEPVLLLLPGSRRQEVERHLPVMLRAARLLQARVGPMSCEIVLPNEGLIRRASQIRREESRRRTGQSTDLRTAIDGSLEEALRRATCAIASTGTVTVECARFGVPTVAMYKTSWLTYAIGKRIVTVRHLAMPNILSDEALFPELIQHAATPRRVADATEPLLRDEARRAYVRRRLQEVVASLGPPGASRRAAHAILSLS